MMPIQTRDSEGNTASQRCHNCRVRRLVCDQTLPSCRKCASRGVECPGYGRNFRWVQPADKTEASKPLTKRARGRPRLQLMEQGTETGSDPSDPSIRSSSEETEQGSTSGLCDRCYLSMLGANKLTDFNRRWIEKLVPRRTVRLEKPLLPGDYIRSKFLLDHLHYRKRCIFDTPHRL